jgi:4-hydroxythreonine-4-phosphate dehydrogenase
MSTAAPAIAITMGDPGRASARRSSPRPFATHPSHARLFVAGDVATVRRASQALASPGQLAWPVLEIESVAEAATVPPGCIPVLQVIARRRAHRTGPISAEAGRVAGECVVWAARAALRGEIAAIVTAPLHKEALSAAGFPYPGHTELLQAEAAAHLGRTVADVPVRMMLANDELRTVLVSIHMSLRHAIEAVRFDGVLETLRITHRALTHALGRVPRIGVAGLNPHAGEGGLFGSEEREIIAPAIEAARAEGIDASGPVAPDTVFMRARAKGGVHPVRVRRGGRDVPRPGPDPGQVPGRGEGRERDAGAAAGADQPRPRHRVRHRRHGPGRCVEPHRGAAHGPDPGRRRLRPLKSASGALQGRCASGCRGFRAAA